MSHWHCSEDRYGISTIFYLLIYCYWTNLIQNNKEHNWRHGQRVCRCPMRSHNHIHAIIRILTTRPAASVSLIPFFFELKILVIDFRELHPARPLFIQSHILPGNVTQKSIKILADSGRVDERWGRTMYGDYNYNIDQLRLGMTFQQISLKLTELEFDW